MTVWDKVEEAVSFIKKQSHCIPEMGIVLGSGLGAFAEAIPNKTVISYHDIPYFKRTDVPGHSGQLILGKIKNQSLVIMQGRYHYYEGHKIDEVVFPIRVMGRLGIKSLILTNAAGGINKTKLKPGDLMILKDHINLMGVNPLRGRDDHRFGPRFPDMSGVYDKMLMKKISQVMKSFGIEVKKGIYVAVSGPSYETPAEIKMLAKLGADAVGMSTVPEAIVARHMNITVAGISLISNWAAGISSAPLLHDHVTEQAKQSTDLFIKLLTTLIPKMA